MSIFSSQKCVTKWRNENGQSRDHWLGGPPPIEPPDSSWLEEDRKEELNEEASELRIDREELEDGEKDKGSNPYSLKYGCKSASLAVIRLFGEKHSIFWKKKEKILEKNTMTKIPQTSQYFLRLNRHRLNTSTPQSFVYAVKIFFFYGCHFSKSADCERSFCAKVQNECLFIDYYYIAYLDIFVKKNIV